MKTILRIFVLLFLFLSCSMQTALKRSFVGKNPAELEKHFGKPAAIIPRSADSLLIFEKKNALEGAEISQGKITLDPIHSPKVTKIERYLFTVREGKIVDASYEKLYEK